MVNACVAFGSANISDSHKIPCDKGRHKLWFTAIAIAKAPALKYAPVCCDRFLEENYLPNYNTQSELLGKDAIRRYLSNFAVPIVFPTTRKDHEKSKTASCLGLKRLKKVVALNSNLHLCFLSGQMNTQDIQRQ